MQRDIKNIDFSSELHFKSSRSSGPGGQNVNKVNTKVELYFDIENSAILTVEEKTLLKNKLASKLTKDFVLIISSQSERTQLRNKEECIRKFYELISDALKIPKKRKKLKISKAAIEKRLKQKKINSEKKDSRKKPDSF